MKLYGQEKSNSEILSFIHKYVDSVKANKRDRYHDILSLFPEGNGSILDYGCGWGHFSIALSEKGYNVSGQDLSQNEIDICNLVWGNHKNVIFEHKEIVEYKNSSFDYVLSNQVIEHVHNAGNYISQINRILKKDGCLVIALPNVMNPRHMMKCLNKNISNTLLNVSKDTLSNYNKTHDHINAWDPVHFTRLISSVGFSFVEFIPMEGVALPFMKVLPSYFYSRSKRLRNLSYTMAFKFRKVKDSQIRNFD